MPEEINRWGDTAYLGMDDDINDIGNWIIPIKNSKKYTLSKEQRKSNKRISGKRIRVEDAIGKMKTFKHIADILTIKTDEFLYSVILTTANLANYKTLMRQGLN